MIRKFKKYLESKEEYFDFDFVDEEDEMDGYYYWINVRPGDEKVKFYKIQIIKIDEKTYDYDNLVGETITTSEHEHIEYDLTNTETNEYPSDEGVAYLFTNLNNNRFKEIYTYYFKDRFNNKVLNNMDKYGLIKSKKIKIKKEPKNYGWGDYDYDIDFERLKKSIYIHDKNEDSWKTSWKTKSSDWDDVDKWK